MPGCDPHGTPELERDENKDCPAVRLRVKLCNSKSAGLDAAEAAGTRQFRLSRRYRLCHGKRAVISFAVLSASGRQTEVSLSSEVWMVWPQMLMAATVSPRRFLIGTATAISPGSSSWSISA